MASFPDQLRRVQAIRRRCRKEFKKLLAQKEAEWKARIDELRRKLSDMKKLSAERRVLGHSDDAFHTLIQNANLKAIITNSPNQMSVSR